MPAASLPISECVFPQWLTAAWSLLTKRYFRHTRSLSSTPICLVGRWDIDVASGFRPIRSWLPRISVAWLRDRRDPRIAYDSCQLILPFNPSTSRVWQRSWTQIRTQWRCFSMTFISDYLLSGLIHWRKHVCFKTIWLKPSTNIVSGYASGAAASPNWSEVFP